MTNSIALVILITTNWINVAGDFKREGGTNYTRQRLSITTNTYVEEITLCTNRTLLKQAVGNSTNGQVRWSPVPPLMPPPLPGQLEKP